MEQPEIPGITNVQKICPSEQPKKKAAVMSLVHMDQSQKESRQRGTQTNRETGRERENKEQEDNDRRKDGLSYTGFPFLYSIDLEE